MAMMILQLGNVHQRLHQHHRLLVRAAADGDDKDFEERLARLQRKVRSGSGKKAELRKTRKEGRITAASRMPVLLPPIPLKDSISDDGLVVELGFCPYSERLNGNFAAVGLTAVLLVELATGSSWLKFHDSAIVGVQLYSVLAAAALLVKYEKEKISVWPSRVDKQQEEEQEQEQQSQNQNQNQSKSKSKSKNTS